MSPFVDSAVAKARRDIVYFYDDSDNDWWSQNGQIVRWAVFGAVVLLVFSYGVFGYWHAKRRVARGLPPLAYHRWLLSRRQRAQFDPRYRDPVPGDSYYGSDRYGMHAYPPPVYDPNSAPPPQYQPPEGASKADPTQGRAEASSTPAAAAEPSPAYTPPLGPPPSALHTNQTGSSSTSNNPFRQ